MSGKKHLLTTYILIITGLSLYVPLMAKILSFTDATPMTTKVSVILLCLCGFFMVVTGLDIQREKFLDIWQTNIKLKAQLEKEREKNRGREQQHEIHPF